MTLLCPLALATSNANANANADKPNPDSNNGRTALPTPKRGDANANPSNPDPLTVTCSKKWSITASGHMNVSTLLNNNIISDTVSVTSESAHCPCQYNPHLHDHPGGEGGTHRTGECGLW